jgi:outer membrane protein assembly factor BamB
MAGVSPSPRGERPLPRLAIGAVLLVLCVAGALVAFDRKEEDVFNPGVGFVDTNEDTPSAPAKAPRADDHPSDDGFSWPFYGYSKARTHHLPLRRAPRPPYRQAWARRGSVLLEFSPVLCGRRLYLLKNNGALYAISRATGRVSWRRKLGYLAAAAPACHDGTIYAVLLSRTKQENAGRIIAIRAKTGSTRWSRQLPSRSESSPLIDHGRIYIGSEDGTVYSIRARDGVVRWRAKAAGAVKGAIALDSGKLYFGDYGGRVHAIRRTDGKKIWSTAPGSGPLGLGGGNFYSSAAVEYGRVFIGSTNGTIYSLASADGKLAWSRSTGGYVYASPAVGQARGGRPTVYIGSYDGRFYALNARTGAPRWTRRLGTKISGAATLIGDTVFVSDLGRRSTWALGARTGKTLWKTSRGAFNPAISDGRRVYFTAYTSLFALDPRGRPFDRAAARSARQQTRAQRAAARKRIERRAKARALAQRERRLKYRFESHGHRHSARLGYRRSCHPHRHVYEIRGRTIVLRHSHCHTHTRAR